MLTVLILCLLLLFIRCKHHALIITVEPEPTLLFQNVHGNLSVCLRTTRTSSCDQTRPIQCSIKGLAESYEDSFTNNLSLYLLRPGPYRFQCIWNGTEPSLSATKLLVNSNDTYLDCTHAPRFVHFRHIWPAFQLCCARPAIPTEWLRLLDGTPMQLCQPVTCKADFPHLSFHREWVYFLQFPDEVNRRKAQIQCGTVFNHIVYFVRKGVQEMAIQTEPQEAALFKQENTRFSICLGWKDQNECEPELRMSARIFCSVRRVLRNGMDYFMNINLTADSTVNFAQWPEGMYVFHCHELDISIERRFMRLILTEGYYRWDCQEAPDVIYLDVPQRDYLFCSWQAIVSYQWRPLVRQLRLGNRTFHCQSEPEGLRFENGLLRLNRSVTKCGLVKITCRPGNFAKTVVIANSPNDFTILLLPNQFVINNTHPGQIRTAIALSIQNDIPHAPLTSRFPVTCSLTYPSLRPRFRWSFVQLVPYAALFDGLLRIRCTQITLSLHRVFHRLIVTGPNGKPSCEPPSVMRVTANQTWYEHCPPQEPLTRPISVTHNEDDIRCVDLQKEYHYSEGILTVLVPPVEPSIVQMLCTAGLHNKTVLFYDRDLKMRFEPEQAFYLAGQKDLIRIILTVKYTTKNESTDDTKYIELLKSIYLQCTVSVEKNESAHASIQLQEPVLNLTHPIFTSLSGSKFYYVTCEAFEGKMSVFDDIFVVDPNEVSLRIIGSEVTMLFEDQEFEYTCILEGPRISGIHKERTGPRWWSPLQGIQITSFGNRLLIDRFTSRGMHQYYCTYRRPWIKLQKTLSFWIYPKSEIKLRFYGATKNYMFYRAGATKQTILCSLVSGTLSLDESIRWTRLSGDLDFTVQVWNEASVVLVPNSQNIASGTFQCSTRVKNRCFSKIITKIILTPQPSIEIFPLVRSQVLPFTIKCAIMDEDKSFYEIKIKALGEVHINLGVDSVRFEESNDSSRFPFVIVICNFKRLYLDADIGSRKMHAIFDVSLPIATAIFPLKDEYKFGDKLTCSGNTSTGQLPASFYMSTKPKNFPRTFVFSSSFTFNKVFVGGVYLIQCLIARPHSLVYAHSHRFFIRQLPTKAEVIPKLKNDTLTHFYCQSDGYPTSKYRYVWYVPFHPGGLILVNHNHLYIVEYTVSGPIRVLCYVIANDGNSSVKVKAGAKHFVTGTSFDKKILRRSNEWIPFTVITSLWSLACILVTISVFRLSNVSSNKLSTFQNTMDDEIELQVGKEYITIKESEIGSAYIVLFRLLIRYTQLYDTIQNVRGNHLTSDNRLSNVVSDTQPFQRQSRKSLGGRRSVTITDESMPVSDGNMTFPRRLSTTVRPARMSLVQPTGQRDSILITDTSHFRDRRLSLDLRKARDDRLSTTDTYKMWPSRLFTETGVDEHHFEVEKLVNNDNNN